MYIEGLSNEQLVRSWKKNVHILRLGLSSTCPIWKFMRRYISTLSSVAAQNIYMKMEQNYSVRYFSWEVKPGTVWTS